MANNADLFGMSDLHSGPGNYQDGTANTVYNTGELRRQYNFGNRVSELNISQDPFFRFLSMCAKQPTNDPSFKFTEERQSWHKRYGYIVGGAAWSSGATAGLTYTTATVACQSPNSNAADGTYALKIGTDYQSSGNIQNIFNQSTAARTHDIGDSGTKPEFFLVDQLLKVPVKSITEADGVEASASGTTRDYQVVKVMSVETCATNYVSLGVKVVRPYGSALVADSTYDVVYATSKWTAEDAYSAPDAATYNLGQHDTLEAMRSYVIGSAHLQGSGYPATWKDQPYSHGYGQTQIWKTAMAMDNTTRATELKYVKNEWGRIWKQKLVEHKWDIEQDLLFGAQHTDDEGVTYTQGAVDYVMGAGNIFSLDFSNKSSDDFLDDMCNYFDPRYNSQGATVFMCDTQTYNWLHKMSGYGANNAGMVLPAQAYAAGASHNPSNDSLGRVDMSYVGGGKKYGVSINQLSTPYGSMNLARNIHLDGSPIKILAINMKYCKYRPLAGNGLNRDTTVYVGVQTLENSGVDRRVDLIQTEAGMEWQMPEAHAIWK